MAQESQEQGIRGQVHEGPENLLSAIILKGEDQMRGCPKGLLLLEV